MKKIILFLSIFISLACNSQIVSIIDSSGYLVFINPTTGTKTYKASLRSVIGGSFGSNAYTSTSYVPQTTTVNGHSLSANISVTPTDLSLVIGTNTQAWDADLDYLSGFTPSANVKTVLNAADNAAIRSAIGLGTLATQSGTFSGTSSGTNTGDQTTVSGNAGTATALQNARTIGGVSFDGTGNITVATATGGFTVSGGDLAIGANNVTVTGSIGSTGSRVTKLWATDIASTNAIAADLTGNAGTATKWATARSLWGNSIDGSGDIATIIASTYGGTGNGFTKFSGASGTEKTYTLPNSNATLLYAGGDAGTPSALVGTNISGTGSSFTAGHATALATARSINGTNFDGSGDITVTAAANTLTGTTLASGVTGSSLTSFGAGIALGTPASGTMTNVSGTAANLTAGNVSTVPTTNSKTFRLDGTYGVAYAKYSFGTDGGSVSTITPGATVNTTIPANAILVGGVINVTTAVTSGGSATVAIGCAGTGGSTTTLLAATAKTSLTLNALLATVPTFAVPKKLTGAGGITFTIGTAALTAGVIEVWIQYFTAAN